jgi:hypothetical protein
MFALPAPACRGAYMGREDRDSPTSANLGMFFFKTPRKRHPERSASQIYRVTLRLGAESKDPEGAYLTHAARTFSTTEAREQDPAAIPT